MNTFNSYLRILFFLTLAYILCEVFITSNEYPTALLNPMVIAILGLFMLILVALETILGAIQSIASQLITEEQKERLAKEKEARKTNQFSSKVRKFLMGTKRVEDAEVLLEDHDYDGIRELDNPLPPWWIYLFYGTLIFGVYYMIQYHIFDGQDQYQEYTQEVVLADREIEAYQNQLPKKQDLVASQDDNMLAQGKKIYDLYCKVCHRPDGGGGIGPNLTDVFWILGGDIKSVYATIENGGRPGKGMVAWKSSLNASQMEQVANYILSLQGTNPPNPKAPEGEEYKPKVSETDEAVSSESI